MRWCGLANSVEKDIKKDLLVNTLLVLTPPVACSPHPTQYNNHDTGVVDYGARNVYFEKKVPIQKFDAAAPKVHVGTITVQVKHSVGTGTLALPNRPSHSPCTIHVMPYFKHNLIGIGSICDDDCKVKKKPLWYTIRNNDPSSQCGGNPLAQNCGAFTYARIQ